MWKYFEDNICREDVPVAKFKNDKGTTIFYVFETENQFVAIPQVSWINKICLSFTEARKMNTPEEEAMEDAHDTLVCAMKHACEYIEKQYNKQVEIIRQSI